MGVNLRKELLANAKRLGSAPSAVLLTSASQTVQETSTAYRDRLCGPPRCHLEVSSGGVLPRQGEVQALFLRHEGYLGAIGAFLKGAEQDSEWSSHGGTRARFRAGQGLCGEGWG